MGAIQSSINNLLATATIAGKLTPGVEEAGAARAATRYATKATKYATKQTEGYTKMVDKLGGEESEAAHRLAEATFSGVDKAVEVAEGAHEKAVSAAEKSFESSPSEKTANKLGKAKFDRDLVADNAQDFKELRSKPWLAKEQKMAEEDAKREQIAKRAETALKWETERVRNSTNFRVYQEEQEKKGQQLFGGNI